MRNRLAVLATTSTVCLLLAISPYSRAQQENQRPARDRTENPTASANRSDPAVAGETIRGVIAGVTAEGEAMFDYRSNRAVATEAAFLTVVGSPVKNENALATRPTGGTSEERGTTERRRPNVYHVWLTPRTKICEGNTQSERSPAQSEAQRAEQKREVAFDNLEVGDHVQIQFVKNDDSGSTGSAHQTDAMRRKHGRDRTYVGFASEITILPSKDARSHDAEGGGKEKRDSQ